MSVAIKKSDEDQQIVWAEVYVPDILDSDNEYMDAETIQKMSYDFMRNLNLKSIDVQHTNDLVEGACVVESFIARKDDPDFIEGSWVVGVHVPDKELWGQIKSGEINGFSLEAMVKKIPQEIEVELPPVVNGRTAKSEDHEHEFFVRYDEEGNFLGGRTSEVNGHFHLIRSGTVTEKADGHTHRFSYVENM